MRLSRRAFLLGIPGVAVALGVAPAPGEVCATPRQRKRVLIVGAGFAGTMVALTLRKLAPEVEVMVIEKGPAFISAPSALEYVFGMASWAEITRGYEALTSRGVRLLRAEVHAINPDRRLVRTTAGSLEYVFLVLATGIRLASEEIAGLAENPEANASIYDRARLAQLRRRVEAYHGGTVLLSIPPPPLQCPPAPYEFALLFAERIRQKKFRGKIILLDASTNLQPASLAPAFEAALYQNQDIIEYVPSARVATLDVGAKWVLTTDGEKFAYDLLSLIPPHRVAFFIQEAGLSPPGDPFVEVDPLTFRSTKVESIYALGDAARTPYARTAASASVTAQVCAHHIASALGIQAVSPTSFQSVCYPYVNRGEALSLRLDYWREARSEGPRLESRVTADTRPRRTYVEERRAWERGLLRQMFGA